MGICCVCARSTQDIAPCIVEIGCDLCTGGTYNARDIALQVLCVVVFGWGCTDRLRITKAYGAAVLVVTEVQAVAVGYIRREQTAVVGVGMACLACT